MIDIFEPLDLKWKSGWNVPVLFDVLHPVSLPPSPCIARSLWDRLPASPGGGLRISADVLACGCSAARLTRHSLASAGEVSGSRDPCTRGWLPGGRRWNGIGFSFSWIVKSGLVSVLFAFDGSILLSCWGEASAFPSCVWLCYRHSAQHPLSWITW